MLNPRSILRKGKQELIDIFYFYPKFSLKNLPENTLQLYLIKIAKWFNLVMPIVVLFYQDNGLSMSQIFLLKSVYSIAMVVTELPSVYLADVWGCRRTYPPHQLHIFLLI